MLLVNPTPAYHPNTPHPPPTQSHLTEYAFRIRSDDDDDDDGDNKRIEETSRCAAERPSDCGPGHSEDEDRATTGITVNSNAVSSLASTLSSSTTQHSLALTTTAASSSSTTSFHKEHVKVTSREGPFQCSSSSMSSKSAPQDDATESSTYDEEDEEVEKTSNGQPEPAERTAGVAPLPFILTTRNQEAAELKSVLKKSNRSSFTQASRPITARRVQGLWNATVTTLEEQKVNVSTSPRRKSSYDCPWKSLPEPTIQSVATYLDLKDRLSLGGTCLRMHTIVQESSSLWQHVDATSYVKATHEYFVSKQQALTQNVADTSNQNNTKKKKKKAKTSADQTAQALCQVLKGHSFHSLRILNERPGLLSASDFFSSLDPSCVSHLQELSLRHLQDLTDTHVHVLLLLLSNAASASTKSPNPKAAAIKLMASPKNKKNLNKKKKQSSMSLHTLALEDCPLLTSACLRSIASTQASSSLQNLSLRGCSQIQQVESLPVLVRKNTQIITDLPDEVAKQAGKMAQPLPSLPALFLGTFNQTTPSSTTSPKKPSLSLANLFPPSKNSPVEDNVEDSKPNTSLTSLFGGPPTTSTSNSKTSSSTQGLSLTNMFALPSLPAQQDKITNANSHHSATQKNEKESSSPSLSGLFAPPSDEKKASNSQQPSISTTDLGNLFAPPATTPPWNKQKDPKVTAPPPASSLTSLFAPPAPANTNRHEAVATVTKTTGAMPSTPPRDTTAVAATTSNSPTVGSQQLQSLFALPGTSPPRRKVADSHSSPTTKPTAAVSSSTKGGKLRYVNLQGTSIPRVQLLQLLQFTNNNHKDNN